MSKDAYEILKKISSLDENGNDIAQKMAEINGKLLERESQVEDLEGKQKEELEKQMDNLEAEYKKLKGSQEKLKNNVPNRIEKSKIVREAVKDIKNSLYDVFLMDAELKKLDSLKKRDLKAIDKYSPLVETCLHKKLKHIKKGTDESAELGKILVSEDLLE